MIQTTNAELIRVLWGIIVILSGALGFFLLSFFQSIKKTKDRLWNVIDDHHSYFEHYCKDLDDGQKSIIKDFEVCKINGNKERERLFEKYKEMYETRYAIRDMFTTFKSWFDREFMERFIHVEEQIANEKDK